jgi:putative transposase
MRKTEIPEDIAALARKIGKQFKSEEDLADVRRLLKKMTVEAALGAELDEHLGYAKHEACGRSTGNCRNGYSSKTLKDAHGEIELETPRDRNGSFEPQLLRKGQTRLTQFDDQIHALYAKGMSTRDPPVSG